jgi:hypothetical protein
VHWIQTSRVSLQRAGTLLAVATAASESRRTSLEALGKGSALLLTAAASISPEQCLDVAEYVKRMHLWQRYEQLRGLSATQLIGKTVQAQDLWLADPTVPSASGAITERVTDEPAQLAVNLRLVRAQNHTLTERGRALRLAASPQLAALRQASTVGPLVNPMLLGSGAGLILLNAFLEADFDFVRTTHAVAVAGRRRFSRADISVRMGDVCRQLREDHRDKIRSGEDRKTLARLKELAESIDSAGDAPTRGGARPPDQTSTVRLEPYVDLGLITRTSRFDYRYELSEDQSSFFTSMQGEVSMHDWIADSLVGCYVKVRSPALTPICPLDQFDVLRESWQELRSQMGYASISEALLLANAKLIDRGAGFFEMAAGHAALRDLHRQKPKSIRFTMARGGAVSYFKLNETGTVE